MMKKTLCALVAAVSIAGCSDPVDNLPPLVRGTYEVELATGTAEYYVLHNEIECILSVPGEVKLVLYDVDCDNTTNAVKLGDGSTVIIRAYSDTEDRVKLPENQLNAFNRQLSTAREQAVRQSVQKIRQMEKDEADALEEIRNYMFEADTSR